MARIIAVGQPENNSERAAIAYLAKHLPDEYVLFHNLEFNAPSSLPYEYDIIVVGDVAVYNVEVKGYRGTISGNNREWELAGGTIYKNPLPLAKKKGQGHQGSPQSQGRTAGSICRFHCRTYRSQSAGKPAGRADAASADP